MSAQPDNRIYFDPPVTQAQTFSTSRSRHAKDAVGKIARLVPAEILAAYGAALGALPMFKPEQQPWIALGCFIAGTLGTGWYVGWRIGEGFAKQKHILVYMLAFAVWAYTLTGKTALSCIYHPGAATLILAVTSVYFSRVKLPAKEVR